MKHYRYINVLIVLVAVSHLEAAQRKLAGPVKTERMAQQTRALLDLKNAGPVWKNANPIEAKSKFYGPVQRSIFRDEKVIALAAAHDLKVQELLLADNGTLVFISGALGRMDQLAPVADAALTLPATVQTPQAFHDVRLAFSWLETFAPAMRIDDAATEFSLSQYTVDDLGLRHIRLQQIYRGLPVWANELNLHLDAMDQVYAVNGRYIPTPSTTDLADPVIDGATALFKARAHLGAKNLLSDIPGQMREALHIPDPRSDKSIWMDAQGQPHLVWQVEMYANLRDWFTLFVDAHSGAVLHEMNNTKSEGAVNASGVDLGNNTRSFRAYEEGGNFYLLSDLNELSGSISDLPSNPAGGLWVIDLRNNDPSEYSTFYHVTSSSQTQWQDHGAVSAIYNMALVYDYWKSTHGRRAIDDAASSVISVVNVTENGRSMGNAYWNGRAIFWGRGDDIFSSLVKALDIAAHEFTHGITEYTANLIYEDQSGALNESMSDVFAVMVDRNDWLMGEDVMQPGRGAALRDVSQPDNPLVLDRLPVTMDQYIHTSEDNGGVHSNCGIPNRAAYLIASSIGREKTEKIYYRALTVYLTRQSQFIDARKALEQSAIDLYGSVEVNAVKAAFDAVKVYDGGSVIPQSNHVQPTTGGSEWIAFIRDDLQVGLYDVVGKTDYVLANMRVKSNSNNLTQLTATADGNYLYFTNENGVVTRANLSNLSSGRYSFETFEEIYINSPGDLWNLAVSRDNKVLAFTSKYEDDNRIYFYIQDQIYSLVLDLPTSQDGITGTTIRFPDVINWSPNTKYPKLAFDAFNQIDLSSGEQRAWWSMGEIDLSGDELVVHALLPAQSDGSSAGNVQYGSTDPDLIAYTYIDAENHWDIKIADFAEPGNNKWLKFTGRDVERPSFSPDDQKFVVDRFSDEKLLIVDIGTLTTTVLNLSRGAYYPEWFVVGGRYDLEVAAGNEEQPAGYSLEANFPNPFNSGTVIAYTLPRSGEVKLQIYNLRGSLVQTLVEGLQTAGRHQLNWSGNDAAGQPLSSGVYFCRLSADRGYSAARKMILVR